MVGGRNDVPLKAMAGMTSQEVHALSNYPNFSSCDIECCEH